MGLHRDRVVGGIGFVGCVGALVCLVVQLARDDVPGLLILLGFALLIAAARVLYIRRTATRL